MIVLALAMTNRQFVSEVIGDLRKLGADGTISKEYVLHKGRRMAAIYIKGESDNRRLFRMMELFTFIDSLPLELAGMNSGTGFPADPEKYARSVMPLPELYSTIYGVILRVFTIDSKKEFTFITPHEYQYTLHRSYKNPAKGYFWLEDNYLVIPDEFMDEVKLSGMFVAPWEARRLISDKIPVERNSEGFCKGPLDDTFICPGHLAGKVRQETVKDLYGFMMKGMQVEDERPDGNTHSAK